MKNRYEALLILDVKGKDESANDIIDRLKGEFQKEGAQVEQVQKLEKRQFTYVAGKLDSGFYANFIIECEPPVLLKLKTKFDLDADVYRQSYSKAPKIVVKTAKPE